MVGGGLVNVAAVMDEIAAELDTITGLRVFAYPPDNVPVPACVVGYPETITYDVTMGRGVDRIDLPVFVLVSRITDRTARDALGPYLNGSGASSVKQVLLNGKPWVAMSSVRVASAEIEAVTVGAVDYLAATFTVNIFGPGD